MLLAVGAIDHAWSHRPAGDAARHGHHLCDSDLVRLERWQILGRRPALARFGQRLHEGPRTTLAGRRQFLVYVDPALIKDVKRLALEREESASAIV